MQKDNLKLEGLGSFTVILASLCIVAYVCYFFGFHNRNFSDDPAIWGTFGDYVGGIVGTVIAFSVFLATIRIIQLQKTAIDLQEEELKATREELEKSRTAQELQAKLFEQQQFETTFFNMLELLSKYSEPIISNIEKNNNQRIIQKTWKIQYHLMLFSLLNHIKQYTNSTDENNKNKYVDIVKANLEGEVFINVITFYKQFLNNQNQMYYPYQELKEMIEKYALFDFIPKKQLENRFIKEENRSSLSQDTYTDDKDYVAILKFFKLSAFENNYDLLADRINLEKNPDELAKYAENEYKTVRLAVAKNKYTAKETLILLSQDSEEEVKQAAVDNANFKS